MATDRFLMPVYCAVILRKGQSVLLMKRGQSVIFGGYYGLPGGGVDGFESVTAATIREIYEELGVVVQEKDLHFMNVQHVKTERNTEYVVFFFQATQWVGQLAIMEPEKCDELMWFDIDALPANLVPSHQQAFALVEESKPFGAFGW